MHRIRVAGLLVGLCALTGVRSEAAVGSCKFFSVRMTIEEPAGLLSTTLRITPDYPSAYIDGVEGVEANIATCSSRTATNWWEASDAYVNTSGGRRFWNLPFTMAPVTSSGGDALLIDPLTNPGIYSNTQTGYHLVIKTIQYTPPGKTSADHFVFTTKMYFSVKWPGSKHTTNYYRFAFSGNAEAPAVNWYESGVNTPCPTSSVTVEHLPASGSSDPPTPETWVVTPTAEDIGCASFPMLDSTNRWRGPAVGGADSTYTSYWTLPFRLVLTRLQ
jgi:hypothetical protein